MSGYTGQYNTAKNDDFFDNPQPVNNGIYQANRAAPQKLQEAQVNAPYGQDTNNNYGVIKGGNTYQPLDVDYPMSQEDQPFDYNNAGVRLGFIRKVYYIITFMLLITFGMVAITYFVPGYRLWQMQNYWLMIVAIVLSTILLYALGCFRQVARAVPWNYLLLTIFTLCFGYFVSYTTAMYNGEAIIISVGITAAVVIALTLYAMFTKTDFTMCWGLMIVLGVTMLIGSILGIWLRNRWYQIGMAVLGCLVFSFYLVVDTQLVIGKNQRAYSVDDYVMAAVAIYLDIIQLFLQILQLVGQAQRN